MTAIMIIKSYTQENNTTPNTRERKKFTALPN